MTHDAQKGSGMDAATSDDLQVLVDEIRETVKTRPHLLDWVDGRNLLRMIDIIQREKQAAVAAGTERCAEWLGEEMLRRVDRDIAGEHEQFAVVRAIPELIEQMKKDLITAPQRDALEAERVKARIDEHKMDCHSYSMSHCDEFHCTRRADLERRLAELTEGA